MFLEISKFSLAFNSSITVNETDAYGGRSNGKMGTYYHNNIIIYYDENS